MKIVRILLFMSLLTYILKCFKLKNKVKYSNYLVGMSDGELEKQSHTINLKYNDLLNVFIDKKYLEESPKKSSATQGRSSNVDYSQNNSAAMYSNKPEKNSDLSNEEMAIWDS
jgi:hypothetical protein